MNLGKIEKKIYGSLFNDGSLDLLWGLMLLGFGLSILLADLGFGISEELMLFTVIPAFVVYFVLLFFVALPRRGVMRLTEKSAKSKSKLLMVQFVWLVLALFAGLYFSTQPVQAGFWNDLTSSLVWITGSIVLFSMLAYSIKIDRFYIYGLLGAIPFPFRVFLKKTMFFDISTGMFFVVSGIIIITGIIVLMRFIQNTPKPGKL